MHYPSCGDCEFRTDAESGVKSNTARAWSGFEPQVDL